MPQLELVLLLSQLACAYASWHGPVSLQSARHAPVAASAEASRCRYPEQISIRPAEPRDVLGLAELCTDVFYGTPELIDGPIVYAQRARWFAGVLMQVWRRLRLERTCECRLLVAEDRTRADGRLSGCVDLAVHVYDPESRAFRLSIDELPDGGCVWRPYVASLAVAERDRRLGIARKLMAAAEEQAEGWGFGEMMLEVACPNAAALAFYEALGYKVVASAAPGTGATLIERRGLFWEQIPTDKFLMRKPLRMMGWLGRGVRSRWWEGGVGYRQLV